MGQKLTGHNNRILNISIKNKNDAQCNCRESESCPMDGKCLQDNVIYQATVKYTDSNQGNIEESYIGLTSDSFKVRYRNHVKSFRNTDYRNETCLSKYIWRLKDEGTPYNISWKILDRATTFSPSTKRCNLCLKEKFFLLTKEQMCKLNTRNEFGNKCRHLRQLLICNTKIK